MRDLGIHYRLMRCKPLLRKLKVRVVKYFPGGPCSRCLSALFISLPRYFECPLELFADRSEGGIIEIARRSAGGILLCRCAGSAFPCGYRRPCVPPR